jgi:hypothetical protein
MGIFLYLYFVLAEDLNWSMLCAGTHEAHESFIFIRKNSACLTKQDKERAICTGLSTQTAMHECSTAPLSNYIKT